VARRIRAFMSWPPFCLVTRAWASLFPEILVFAVQGGEPVMVFSTEEPPVEIEEKKIVFRIKREHYQLLPYN